MQTDSALIAFAGTTISVFFNLPSLFKLCPWLVDKQKPVPGPAEPCFCPAPAPCPPPSRPPIGRLWWWTGDSWVYWPFVLCLVVGAVTGCYLRGAVTRFLFGRASSPVAVSPVASAAVPAATTAPIVGSQLTPGKPEPTSVLQGVVVDSTFIISDKSAPVRARAAILPGRRRPVKL